MKTTNYLSYVSKRMFFLLAFSCVILTSCEKYDHAISDIEDRLDRIEGISFPTIDQQIAAINGSIDDLKAMDAELGGYITALQATAADLQSQVDATNTTLAALESDLEGQITASEQKVLGELNTVKAALEGQLATINNTIQALQAKDAELDQKITDLQKYVDDEITATENWASATFSTLQQYEATQTAISEINALIKNSQESITALEEKLNKKIADDIAAAVAGVNADVAAKVTEITSAYTTAIATAKEEITAAYTDAIKTAITASETAMKEWVNGALAEGYYTKAEIDGKITALETQVAEGDAALQKEIDALEAILAGAEGDLTAAYKKAIEDAITENNGVIDGTISAAITAATNDLQSKIDAINTEIASIKSRLDTLEKNFINRIQSLVFIPQYSDGKILMDYNSRTTEVHFRVSPAKIAAMISAGNVSAFARYTDDPTTRALEAEFPLAVLSATGDASSGIIEVELQEDSNNLLDSDFWAGVKEAVIYIRISDGNSDVVSDAVPMIAHSYGSSAGNSINGFDDGGSLVGEVTE